MNKEIKFRAWSKKHNKWLNKEQSYLNLFDIYSGLYNTLKLEIQQFTGLLDKNGKEIYEGDIVKDLDEENGVIEFNNGSFIVKCSIIIPFWSVVEMNGMVLPRTLNPNTFEVIGNIFENPDLIKQTSE